MDILFDSPIQHFIDVPRKFWGYQAIEGAYRVNIIMYNSPMIIGNQFFPNKKAKRGELSEFIYYAGVYGSER